MASYGVVKDGDYFTAFAIAARVGDILVGVTLDEEEHLDLDRLEAWRESEIAVWLETESEALEVASEWNAISRRKDILEEDAALDERRREIERRRDAIDAELAGLAGERFTTAKAAVVAKVAARRGAANA